MGLLLKWLCLDSTHECGWLESLHNCKICWWRDRAEPTDFSSANDPGCRDNFMILRDIYTLKKSVRTNGTNYFNQFCCLLFHFQIFLEGEMLWLFGWKFAQICLFEILWLKNIIFITFYLLHFSCEISSNSILKCQKFWEVFYCYLKQDYSPEKNIGILTT